MKLIVTGAAGFIGSHTCERLVALGHRVVGLDSYDSYLYDEQSKRENARILAERLPADAFALVEGDICDEQTMNNLVGAGDVDVVCHLAALAGVRPSLREPLRYIHTNLRGTGVVLQACRAANVKRLVYASSSSVYGVRADDSQDLQQVEAFGEDDPCLQPASPYAATKRSAELLCSTYCDLYGIGVSSLRFFTVYGPRQRPDMAIHKFVKAIDAGAPISVFGDGSSRRDYTYIDDIVAGTVAACERVKPGDFAIYNLGGTGTVSLSDLIEVIENTVGKKAILQHRAPQPGDVPITFADITHARRDLGYQPTTSLEQGVAGFFRWYQQRTQGRPMP